MPRFRSGLLHLRGSAAYQDIPGKPAMETAVLSGELTSPQLVVKTAKMQAAIANLAAHYSVAHGDARLIDLRAGLLGGEVTAQGTVTQLGGAHSHSQFTASLRHISLAAANRLAAKQGAAPVELAGVLNADAKAAWGNTIADMVANVDANIHGSAAPKSGRRAGGPGELVRAGHGAHRQRDSRHLQRRAQRNCTHRKATCAPTRPR